MVTTSVISDPIGDLLIRFKNAHMAGLKVFDVPSSKEKEKLLGVLQKHGYIKKVTSSQKGVIKILNVEIAQLKARNIYIKRISKPGRRVYIGVHAIYPVKGRRGLLLIHTSKGIMTGVEAKEKKLGGEVIAELF